MDMLENSEKNTIRSEVIALPPLKMALFHAVDAHLTRTALVSGTRKPSGILVLDDEQLEKQSLNRIIEHLEKKP
jgi:hypothetical protein